MADNGHISFIVDQVLKMMPLEAYFLGFTAIATSNTAFAFMTANSNLQIGHVTPLALNLYSTFFKMSSG